MLKHDGADAVLQRRRAGRRARPSWAEAGGPGASEQGDSERRTASSKVRGPTCSSAMRFRSSCRLWVASRKRALRPSSWAAASAAWACQGDCGCKMIQNAAMSAGKTRSRARLRRAEQTAVGRLAGRGEAGREACAASDAAVQRQTHASAHNGKPGDTSAPPSPPARRSWRAQPPAAPGRPGRATWHWQPRPWRPPQPPPAPPPPLESAPCAPPPVPPPPASGQRRRRRRGRRW